MSCGTCAVKTEEGGKQVLSALASGGAATAMSNTDFNKLVVTAKGLRTTKRMPRAITALCEKHDVDLEQSDAHLRLEMPNFDPLVIETTGPGLVSVAHYYEQDGDSIADPNIVFLTCGDEWVPVEATMALGGFRRYVTVKDGLITAVGNRAMQRDLTTFANAFARNIVHQRWLERAERKDPSGQGFES